MIQVAHNLLAMNSQRQLNITTKKLAKTTEKLSSGYRINRAADDAANLEISEKMRLRIRGLNKGAENIEDGISLLQVADGALAEVHDMLHRMTELSIKAANGTNVTADRMAIQKEIRQLSGEVTRIGKTTTFNGLHILDDITWREEKNKNVQNIWAITDLVSCRGAENGYLSDATYITNRNGVSYWMPSATLDFSGINTSNIHLLNGNGFSFNCSRGCSEVFDFKFVTDRDGTQSSATKLNGKVRHYYTIDISNCRDGQDIVDTIFSYVSNHLPYNNGIDAISEVNTIADSLLVSHSNNMMKTADGKGLLIYANSRVASYTSFISDGFATAEAAKSAYPLPASYPNRNIAGAIDCSSLTSITHAAAKPQNDDEEITNRFLIQCSSIYLDAEMICTHRVNSRILDIDRLNVLTSKDAMESVEKVEKALDKLSGWRSELGAFQNRLEHSYANNKNKEENLQAAESRIRDADMALEAVSYAQQTLLQQAGTAMLAQANQSNQGVLTLLT